MSASLQKENLQWVIRDRISSRATLQKFMFYHLDLIACGSQKTRDDYLRIRRFYLGILGISVSYLRGNMCSKSLDDLDRNSFDEPIMGEPAIKISHSIPRTNGGKELPIITETGPLPGTDNTDPEGSNMMKPFGITNLHNLVTGLYDLAEHMNFFAPSRGPATSSFSSTTFTTPNDSLPRGFKDNQPSCIPIFQFDDDVESDEHNDSVQSSVSQSEGEEDNEGSQEESQNDINGDGSTSPMVISLTPLPPRQSFSWADDVEDAMEEEEEIETSAVDSNTNGYMTLSTTSPGRRPASSMYGGELPQEVSKLRDAVHSLPEEHPSIQHDDDNKSSDSWGSESTSSTDTSSTGSAPWYDIEEVEQQWRAELSAQSETENTEGQIAQQEDEKDPLLDTWHEGTDRRWWQQEGMFLVMLAKHSFKDSFREARQAYLADPWDRYDGIDKSEEQARNRRRGKGSPLRQCITIEY